MGEEIDWEKLMDEFEANLEKYARLDEQIKKSRQKNENLRKIAKEVNKFAEENDLTRIEMVEKKSDKKKGE